MEQLGKKKMTRRKWKSIRLFLYVAPFIALVIIFSYYPLYGWIYAFYDYRPPKPFSEAQFVGLKWFKSLVENDIKIKQIVQVLKNTFAMSALTLGTSWLPNFVSWVLVYSVAFSLFNSTGMANTLLMKLGFTTEPILFLQSTKHVWFTQWLWLTWKNLGWAAIMYIAAISGIDDELFQAAKVDGANRMQLIRHITIPSLIPTYFVLLMINIANFLNNGMEQYYVFQNAFNKQYIQVLDLYVYNTAMGSGSYSVSVAISMLKSVVSVILLVGANTFSKKVRGESFI